MATHSALTGAELHEPKGAAAASANEVYVANGDGASGTWTSTANAYKHILNVSITDISAAASYWVVAPVAGNIVGYSCVIDGVLITGDATLTLEVGGTLVGSSGMTVAFTGSAAGTVDTVATTATAVTAGQAIEVITDGGSTNVVRAQISIEMDVS
jgi:hypothetical protein